LSSRLKLLCVTSSSRKWAGRLFQTRGPATAKLLSPNVLCVRGTVGGLQSVKTLLVSSAHMAHCSS